MELILSNCNHCLNTHINFVLKYVRNQGAYPAELLQGLLELNIPTESVIPNYNMLRNFREKVGNQFSMENLMTNRILIGLYIFNQMH